MKFRGLQSVNITALFSEQLNHQLISPDTVASLFATGDTQKDVRNVVEAPGLKIINLPNQKKTVAFEPNRLIVSNNDGGTIKESELLGDFVKVFSISAIDKSKLAGYGFNFDGLAEADDTDLSNIIGSKLLQLSSNIKQAGAVVSFVKDNITYILELKPIQEKAYHVHLNNHYQSSIMPSPEVLESELKKRLIEFQDLIKKI